MSSAPVLNTEIDEYSPRPAKVALFDIETAPSLANVWEAYQTDVISFKRDWYILSFAYKWLGAPKTFVHALPDYSTYQKRSEDDSELVRELWRVFDAADIVVGHNSDSFDIKKANSRFAIHNLPPPSPYRSVDTKTIAYRRFRFDRNKLDELGRYFGVGRKMTHTGFDLWQRCMDGDEAAWALMKRYNRQDVILLEKVYLRLRPWATNHPTVSLGLPASCPRCGSESFQRRGYTWTALGSRRQRYRCNSCHGWWDGAAKREGKK